MTIPLDPTLEDALAELAADRRRGSAELAAEAVADDAARERERRRPRSAVAFRT